MQALVHDGFADLTERSRRHVALVLAEHIAVRMQGRLGKQGRQPAARRSWGLGGGAGGRLRINRRGGRLRT